MPVRGDFGKLRALAGRLRDMADGKLLQADSQFMSESKAALQETIAESFLYQRSTSGDAWKPRVRAYGDSRDGNPILFDLLSSLKVEIAYGSWKDLHLKRGGKLRVTSSKTYAFYHQNGTRKMAARRFLPEAEGSRSLTVRIQHAAVRAVRAFLRA